MLDAMSDISLGKGVEETSKVDGSSGNKIVPRCHAEATVKEKEDHEDGGEEVVRRLEELVPPVAVFTLLVIYLYGWRHATYRIHEMDMKVSHPCAIMAITPVNHTPPVVKASATSPL